MNEENKQTNITLSKKNMFGMPNEKLRKKEDDIMKILEGVNVYYAVKMMDRLNERILHQSTIHEYKEINHD